MENELIKNRPALLQENLQLILEEQLKLASAIDFSQVAQLIAYLYKADHIFMIGAGRTGFAMRAAAMRLMHLGLRVFVVGETTTPAIGPGDLLIAASGSGTTSTIVTAAEKAKKVAAQVLAISTTDQSPLSSIASVTLVLPAAQKQDHHTEVSAQYAGSLFEQATLLIMDAVFQTIWKEDNAPAEMLWKRHANLE